jgi:hypothetical protein
VATNCLGYEAEHERRCHQSNETKLSDRRRERAWPQLKLF